MSGRQSNSFDVVVTGAGMVGCTAACLFAKMGMRVCIIDNRPIASWQASETYARVSAINPGVVNIFRFLGVWPEIEKRRIHPYSGMCVWEHQGEAKIEFNSREFGKTELGFIVENNAITSALGEKLTQNYNVTIMENTTLSDIHHEQDSISIAMETNKSLSCKLLVGADGAHSKVRQLSDLKTQEYDYRQNAIVSSVTVTNGHKDTAWQCFLPTGPVAMLPLDDGRCSIVWSCDQTFSEHILSLDESGFCSEISRYFGSYLGEITDCAPRLSFPLKQHHATRYISDMIALVGDAAHITHPLAGLGANIGLTDAAALAQVVDEANARGRNFSSHTVLRRYERWRRGENALVLETMKAFKTVFGSHAPAIESARKLGLNIANEIKPVKHALANRAMGISGDVPEICRH